MPKKKAETFGDGGTFGDPTIEEVVEVPTAEQGPSYRVLSMIIYKDTAGRTHRREPGDIVDDIPEVNAVGWLSSTVIERVLNG
jgi:hypothetical protein